MSTDRDVTRIVSSWLEEGATALPDRVLDNVLDRLPATRQRRAWWPAWRLREMNTLTRFAVASAAIAVVAVVGFNLLPRSPGLGAPVATPTPTPAPVATPTPTVTPTASAVALPFPPISPRVDPGTYYWFVPELPAELRFTFPEGWTSRYSVAWKNRGGPDEMALGPWIIANVFADPCRWRESLLDPPVGPTVDDLVAALIAQERRDASPPTDVTFGGYPAKRIELSMPADLDLATCDDGVIRTWMSPGEVVGGDPDYFGPRNGQLNVVYIVDVDGSRLVFDTWHMPATPATDLAELETVVESVDIEVGF